MVVDAVVQYWVAVVVERSDGKDGNGQEGKHQSALFYADESMVV